MEAVRELKAKIDSKQLVTGVLAINQAWPELVDVCLIAELDYLIVCMEHGAVSAESAAAICAAGRLAGLPVLLRPPKHDFNTIGRTMDLGACGMLIPCVESGAELDVVRDGIYVPPRGRRRPGGAGNRCVDGIGHDDWREWENQLIILPQIETQRGLDHVDEIAAHEVTTSVAIGPYDLSMNLGVGNQPKNPKLIAARDRIRAAAESAGKLMWMIGDGQQLVDDGFTFICIGEPVVLMQTTLAEKVKELKAES